MRTFKIVVLLAVMASVLQAVPAQAASTFTVNTTEDGPDAERDDGICLTSRENCSLRAAIQSANSTPGLDAIDFSFSAEQPVTLIPEIALPAITQPVNIDATMFVPSGGSSGPSVYLDGTGAAFNGLTLDRNADPAAEIDSSGSTIKGLGIIRFGGHGIAIKSSNNGIYRNYIGVRPGGRGDMGNVGDGINISNGTIGNLIGGTAAGPPADGNVISDNAGRGLSAGYGPSGAVLQVRNNFVGSDPSGTAPMGNGGRGIDIRSRAFVHNNVVIANGAAGIWLVADSLSDRTGSVTVGGNSVGRAVDGAIYGNAADGIVINYNQSGLGSSSIFGNTAVGNDGTGISASILRGATVSNNYVGTDIDGGDHGNTGSGLAFSGGSDGAATAAGNTVAYNDGTGVVPGNGAQVTTGNSIHSNGGLGIDRGTAGVTPNTPGVNYNFPVITDAVVTTGGLASVTGIVNTAPDSPSHNIQLYKNSECDPSGHGEGQTFIAQFGTSVSDANNNRTWAANVAVKPGDILTATATRSGSPPNGTSEFSTCVPVRGPDLTVSQVDDHDPIIVGENLQYAVTVTNSGNAPAPAATLTDTLPANTNFFGATPSQGSCSPAPGSFSCSLGTIPAGGNALVTVAVVPTVAGSISNLAQVATTTDESDAGNNQDTETTLVKNANQDPILSSIGPQVVDEGGTLTFTVSGTDPDAGDSLTYELSPTPPGASLDPSTGVFTWTPTFTQADTWGPLTFSVSDGIDEDFDQIYITVNETPQPTTLSMKVKKLSRSLKFTGSLAPSLPGKKVSVTLYKKKGARFVKLGAKTATLSSLSKFATSLPRPSSGTCKAMGRYAGDSQRAPSTKTLQFSC